MTNLRPIRIFLVEDNIADVWLIEEALKRQSLEYELDHYLAATEAIHAARKCGSGDSTIPDLMLLDYSLPQGNGNDVLAAASENPKLVGVPKAILSSYFRATDREFAFQLGVDCLIEKPASLDQFLEVVGTKVVELLHDGQDRA